MQNTKIEKPNSKKYSQVEYEELRKKLKEVSAERRKIQRAECTKKWNEKNKERKNELNRKYYKQKVEKGEVSKYLYHCEACDKYVSHMKNHCRGKGHNVNLETKKYIIEENKEVEKKE